MDCSENFTHELCHAQVWEAMICLAIWVLDQALDPKIRFRISLFVAKTTGWIGKILLPDETRHLGLYLVQ